MTPKADIRAEAEALRDVFTRAGATPVEAPLMLSADLLLDLYGEDIRARAYTTDDPDRGEMMLRPDFTVPVVQAHMARAARGRGAEPACYTYLGEVFRKQPAGSGRPSEYLQLGFERFGDGDPARADAAVFALFHEALAGLNLRAVTGDMGILLAAIECLSTTPVRKAALRRHVWRPRRFRALLERYTGRRPPPAGRAELLAKVAEAGLDAVIDAAGVETGLRSRSEIAARVAHLRADARTPPIAATEAEALSAILNLEASLPDACGRLRDLEGDLPGLAPAVDRFAARITALEAAGLDPAALPFEASFGRTTMEYYDGFVFGFLAEGRPDMPPVATGGRYDALTAIVGQGAAIPAVGGVIRPELVHELRGGARS
ncbi:ATP phosphoribosyltransferase regulatory subunit [Roseibacterium sp. SDUM158017]|uniref:ATP phosphoribosyltransferase regulatory subunit n=1 Tax=Roseicyclus salinarum TaxID=3036773 RepID=UPI00241527C3|nr:ATP phosphoribosyltransferase regulatory subunit [Roseibacterium sp. SDUM158017]MDG4647258.1 ATP phosphoribosyltransferase regulatory subunit [Roseibacterium sp. SDUM158017]